VKYALCEVDMILEKILLGILLSAPIGPVSLEMIKRGLNGGFLRAFIIRVGGAVGNILCLIAAYFGLGFVSEAPQVLNFCGLLGSMVLIYMGIKAITNQKRHSLITAAAQDNSTILNGLVTGFILSIVNPIGIMFWLSIFAASMSVENISHSSWLGFLESTAIILGVLLWGAFLSLFLELGKRYFTDKMIYRVTLCAGILLIGFGFKYGLYAVRAIEGYFV